MGVAPPRAFVGMPAAAMTGCVAPIGVAGWPVAFRKGWAAPGPFTPGDPGWMKGEFWGYGGRERVEGRVGAVLAHLIHGEPRASLGCRLALEKLHKLLCE